MRLAPTENFAPSIQSQIYELSFLFEFSLVIRTDFFNSIVEVNVIAGAFPGFRILSLIYTRCVGADFHHRQTKRSAQNSSQVSSSLTKSCLSRALTNFDLTALEWHGKPLRERIFCDRRDWFFSEWYEHLSLFISCPDTLWDRKKL